MERLLKRLSQVDFLYYVFSFQAKLCSTIVKMLLLDEL